MSVPILYHYPMSPYSEKLRLTMGLLEKRWLSAPVPAYPPRPELAELIGGYRRVPVLQIGAHFYCDTRIAFTALTGHESGCWDLSERDEALRHWAEQEVFFAVVAGASPYRAVRFLTRELGLPGLMRFMRDRIVMTREATIVQQDPKAARGTILSFVCELAERLAEESCLSGPVIGYLDLCCFHPLWMAAQIDSRQMSGWPSTVKSWFARVEAMGHGVSTAATTAGVTYAIANDQAALSIEVVEAPFIAAQPVTVAPTDYARDESRGLLTRYDGRRIVLERRLEGGERVYLHFPRESFVVRGLPTQ